MKKEFVTLMAVAAIGCASDFRLKADRTAPSAGTGDADTYEPTEMLDPIDRETFLRGVSACLRLEEDGCTRYSNGLIEEYCDMGHSEINNQIQSGSGFSGFLNGELPSYGFFRAHGGLEDEVPGAGERAYTMLWTFGIETGASVFLPFVDGNSQSYDIGYLVRNFKRDNPGVYLPPFIACTTHVDLDSDEHHIVDSYFHYPELEPAPDIQPQGIFLHLNAFARDCAGNVLYYGVYIASYTNWTCENFDPPCWNFEWTLNAMESSGRTVQDFVQGQLVGDTEEVRVLVYHPAR